MTSSDNKQWKALEELIAEIQKDLSPEAKITHNALLYGHDSHTERQVDVLVEQSIGQFDMKIIFECKDYKRPVDLPVMQAFIGMLEDVRAHHGNMVSAKGFTKSAKTAAKNSKININLYSPVDTAPHKWQTRLMMPVLCDFRGASIAFGLKCSAPYPMKLPMDFYSSLAVYDSEGNSLGSCVENAINRWNDAKFPIDVGSHNDIPLFEIPVHIDNGYGMRVPVNLYVSLIVRASKYYGSMPISKIRGFKNEQTGHIVTNAFETNLVSPTEIERSWVRLDDNQEPPGPVSMEIMGLDCYEIKSE